MVGEAPSEGEGEADIASIIEGALGRTVDPPEAPSVAFCLGRLIETSSVFGTHNGNVFDGGVLSFLRRPVK